MSTRAPASLAKLAQRLRRERVASLNIPYSAHVTPQLIKMPCGDYCQTVRLSGATFESADDEELNRWHERLNILWRNIANPRVALWTHLIRRRDSYYPDGEFRAGFAADLNAKYRARMAGEKLMVNELYLSVIYRPQLGAVGGAALKLFNKVDAGPLHAQQKDALEACAKLADQLKVALERYEPENLGIYRHRSHMCSSLLEFFGLLINGEWQRVAVPRAPLSDVLSSSRLLFGGETLEYRTPTRVRLGAFLGIKEYPTPTYPGTFNALLTAPFELVLTQSFTFIAKSTAQALLRRQFNRMVNAGDLAITQAEHLKVALDDLSGNEFALGDHHFSLQVLDEADVDTRPTERIRQLNSAVAHARSLLADTGMVVAREDLALEAAFWAQLPGNFALRPRCSPVSTRNFAALAAFHNYPVGRAHGNHWGPSLALLETQARSPFHLTLHASDERDPSGGSRKDTGHTFICGPTGSGKTVLLGFLVVMFEKFNATQVLFDKDRGLEILVRALGGRYLALKTGTPTGFNPLRLPVTATNHAFLYSWLTQLVQQEGQSLSVRQETDLLQALRGTLALDAEVRCLSRLLEFLDPTDPEGLHARLARWCRSTGGDLAWAFDNDEDRVVNLLSTNALVGFDVTEFLEQSRLRTAISLYIFHLMRALLDGRRLVVWMDEFARILADSAFEAFAKDGLKTWRKMNALGGFATQSPSDVLMSPIARTIIEQTPTKIFFPNADARRADYCEGFGLSEREFDWVRQGMAPGSRSFLFKQNHQSVVCQLDLRGFDFELDVISGRTRHVELVNRIIGAAEGAPAEWLAQFRDARAGALA